MTSGWQVHFDAFMATNPERAYRLARDARIATFRANLERALKPYANLAVSVNVAAQKWREAMDPLMLKMAELERQG